MRNGKNNIEIMVLIIKLNPIDPMDAFKNPSTPPAAKALSLVRLHHGAPGPEKPSIPSFDGIARNASRTAWKQGAKMNHLHAKRRQRVLENIDGGAMPVILEIDGGRNFVVLKERIGDEFIVQFPDSREAPVSLERLNERYSGFCIFLSPANENARGGFFRQILGSLKKS